MSKGLSVCLRDTAQTGQGRSVQEYRREGHEAPPVCTPDRIREPGPFDWMGGRRRACQFAYEIRRKLDRVEASRSADGRGMRPSRLYPLVDWFRTRSSKIGARDDPTGPIPDPQVFHDS